MARFFLDVLNGRGIREDPEGQEFADLDAARAEAVASARYLVAHAILQNEDASDRSFLIRDENGQTVATEPLADCLDLGSFGKTVHLGPGEITHDNHSATELIFEGRHRWSQVST